MDTTAGYVRERFHYHVPPLAGEFLIAYAMNCNGDDIRLDCIDMPDGIEIHAYGRPERIRIFERGADRLMDRMCIMNHRRN